MADDIVLQQCVADAMVTCPKTHAPDSQLQEIYALFADEHVHMALVVGLDGRLITTIERPDLVAGSSGQTSLVEVGTLAGRTVGPSDDLAATTARLFREGRRRLAVIDDAGCLLGLLCLKRDGTGFCSDDGVRERARQVTRAQEEPPRPRRTVALQVTSIHGDTRFVKSDDLVTEEPLEIRVAGPRQDPQPVGVTMRTPGNDFELAAGFLLSEGVVSSQDMIQGVAYCSASGIQSVAQRYNVVTVRTYRPIDLEGHRRLFTISSACGVCGRTTLDQIEQRMSPLASGMPWPFALLITLPDALRAKQVLFSKTGGLHGAGLFDRAGTALAVREDVGRHNAVDKLVGWAALNRRLPLHEVTLVVSGRLGFEIVQKAALAGISHVVAVSAPSSLAIDLARRMGMTIVAFVRDNRANVYCGIEGVA